MNILLSYINLETISTPWIPLFIIAKRITVKNRYGGIIAKRITVKNGYGGIIDKRITLKNRHGGIIDKRITVKTGTVESLTKGSP